MNKVTPDTPQCPECGTSWVGQKIPEKYLDQLGGRTHFSRLKSFYSLESDRTVCYKCPDCNVEFPR